MPDAYSENYKPFITLGFSITRSNENAVSLVLYHAIKFDYVCFARRSSSRLDMFLFRRYAEKSGDFL